MLLKLTPDQIGNNWPFIQIVLDNLIGVDSDRNNRILQLMISNEMHVLACYEKRSGKFEAVIITSFAMDGTTRVKSLVVYGLYAVTKISKDSWYEGFDQLQKFASGWGCSRIIAFTKNQAVNKLAKKFGFIPEFFLTKEVK